MSISINNEMSKLNNLNNNYEDEHKDKLYIIHNFNPSIYFLNEDINIVKQNNAKLLITNIGKYSITKPLQGKWIKSILIDFFKIKKINTKFLSIIDANAGIGGDTIYFSKYFQTVHAIEKNKIHFNVLKNNINALHLKNVSLYEGNFINIIKDHNLTNTKHILYMDPPWGGPEYKKQDFIDLEIELDKPNEKKLHEVMNELFKYFNIIFLKAPINIKIIKSNFLFKNIFFRNDPEKKILLIIFSKI